MAERENPRFVGRSAAGWIQSALSPGGPPIVAVLGPRQCGKTTIARQIAKGRAGDYFDLEDPVDRARLANPRIALGTAKGLVVIDEIQRVPELFEVLRVLVDRPSNQARFLVLGSASTHLVRGVSESLAGRVFFIEMGGFDLGELGASRSDRLWLRGSFPRSFLAPSEADSMHWRNDFIRTFLERDIPQLGINIPAASLRRFWTMVAHYHGQTWNAAEFARSIGSTESTARRYLDILTGSYVLRQLQPWFENIGKRQVKAPKVYVRDSGLLHALLEMENHRQLASHPKVGASWEGFVVEQILGLMYGREAYFWATYSGAELDLLLTARGKRLGFEVKYSDAPTATKSMRIALEDLKLHRLYVVYPGARSYRLDPKIEVVAINDLVPVLATIK
jgi:uncharacterized protein